MMSGQIDDSNVPEAGVYATCPQCNEKFLVKREAPKVFVFEPVDSVGQETQLSETTSIPHYENKASTPKSTKPVKKMEPILYALGAYGGFLFLIGALMAELLTTDKVLVGILAMIAVIGWVCSTIYGLVCLGRCWSIIQGISARTTPGKAVGFLFIPVFNIYWAFVAYVGLAADVNKFAVSQGLKIRINYSLAVASCVILLIPYLNFISFIFFTALFYQMADFYNEVIDKWEQLSELPDTSKSVNAVMISIAAGIAALAIIGILAAIAIPQFSAYKRRALQKADATPVLVEQAAPATVRGFIESSTGMEFVAVNGGCFQMGDNFGDGMADREKPVHEVCVSDFVIGKYEVTQGQWRKLMGSNPSKFNSCGDNCPVEQVSWNDVQQFIQRLNSQSGRNFRLPTEAEWEFAARSGGKHEKYSGGDNVDAVAWYGDNSGKMTHPVGQKQANGLGLYDMSGNVWEWVSDWYGNYPIGSQQNSQGTSVNSDSPPPTKASPKQRPTTGIDFEAIIAENNRKLAKLRAENSPVPTSKTESALASVEAEQDPHGPSSGSGRVGRGGGCGSDAWIVRAAIRFFSLPDFRDNLFGFRLASPVQ